MCPVPVRRTSALAALALIAASMHSVRAEVGAWLHMCGVGFVGVVNGSGGGVIQLTRVRIRSGPTRPLAYAFLLGFKQGADLLGRLLRSHRPLARTASFAGC